MSSDDTEITLGVGKLLGLFLLLAALCGVFFSIGYSLGKSSGREQALGEQPGEALAAEPPAAATSGPVADKQPDVAPAKSDSNQTASGQAASDHPQSSLTFYKAVQQNSGDQQPPAKAPVAEGTPASRSEAKAPAPVETASAKGPESSHSTPVTGPGTIVVQIAAVSREDDAVALAGALRKKNYNVFVVNNPVTNDKLYHVQVGPFATMAEAEAMKNKLTGEGYNPIIKR